MSKNPYVAAMLNVAPIPIGLGYLYLGDDKRFLNALIAGLGGLIVGLAMAAGLAQVGSQGARYHEVLLIVTASLPVAVVTLVCAIDAFALASESRVSR